jgi:hypothetical protein
MKRTALMAAAIACATTFGALAQSPSTTTASSTTDDKITLSGCLQDNSHSSSTTASTSTASTSTASGQSGYVLITGATPAADTTATTAGSTTSSTTATGTSGRMPSSSARSGATYVLEGRDSELKNHIGHRVEVTGTIDNKGGSDTTSSAATTTSGSASTRMSDSAKTLKVASIRMLGSDCSSK